MKRIIGLVLTFVFLLSIPVSLADDDIARRYQQAQMLLEIGDYLTAAQILESLGDYKDSKEMLKQAHEHTASPKPSVSYEPGYVLTFGHYDQDDDIANGAEPIEWIVLESDGETATLISKYGLDTMPYNEYWEDTTWETCTLRKWLNEDFLNTAFDAEEQDQLETVTVKAEMNPNYKINPGRNTQDKVYLLSIGEADRFFTSNAERICKATKTAMAHGARVDEATCHWWLRSLGSCSSEAVFIYGVGVAFNQGDRVDGDHAVVRPVVVLRLTNERTASPKTSPSGTPETPLHGSWPSGEFYTNIPYENDNWKSAYIIVAGDKAVLNDFQSYAEGPMRSAYDYAGINMNYALFLIGENDAYFNEAEVLGAIQDNVTSYEFFFVFGCNPSVMPMTKEFCEKNSIPIVIEDRMWSGDFYGEAVRNYVGGL